jgi:hypothetical protein
MIIARRMSVGPAVVQNAAADASGRIFPREAMHGAGRVGMDTLPGVESGKTSGRFVAGAFNASADIC